MISVYNPALGCSFGCSLLQELPHEAILHKNLSFFFKWILFQMHLDSNLQLQDYETAAMKLQQLPYLTSYRQWNFVDLFFKQNMLPCLLFFKSFIYLVLEMKSLLDFGPRDFCPTWLKSLSHTSRWTIFFFFLLESVDFLYKQFWTVTDMDTHAWHWSQICHNLLK